MWLGSDDSISHSFISDHVEFFLTNPDYVASTGTAWFDHPEGRTRGPLPSIESDQPRSRANSVVGILPMAHNLFYSLARSEVISKFRGLGETYLAADWIYDLQLLTHRKVRVSNSSWIIFGTSGISRKHDALQMFSEKWWEKLFPLTRFLFDSAKLGLGLRASVLLLRISGRMFLEACFGKSIAFGRKLVRYRRSTSS